MDVDDSEWVQKFPMIDNRSFKYRKIDRMKAGKRSAARCAPGQFFWEHIRKQGRNMADCGSRPAPSGLKASIWKHFGLYKVYGESELD